MCTAGIWILRLDDPPTPTPTSLPSGTLVARITGWEGRMCPSQVWSLGHCQAPVITHPLEVCQGKDGLQHRDI